MSRLDPIFIGAVNAMYTAGGNDEAF